MELFDSTLIQAGLLADSSESDMFNQLSTGVVWAAYAYDSKDNGLKHDFEYDVLLVDRRLIRARSAIYTRSSKGGVAKRHRPTTATMDGSRLDQFRTPLSQMNGDHVLLQAAYGFGETVYITHVLDHPHAEMSALKQEKAEEIRVEENGLKWSISMDGELEVDVSSLDKQSIKLKTKGTTITLTDSLLQVESGGSVHKIPTASVNQAVGSLIGAINTYVSAVTPLMTTLQDKTLDPATKAYATAVLPFLTALSTSLTAVMVSMGYNIASPPAPPPVSPAPATDAGTLVLKNMKVE